MWRRLNQILTLACVLAIPLLIVCWIRGLWYVEGFTWSRPYHQYALLSASGTMELSSKSWSYPTTLTTFEFQHEEVSPYSHEFQWYSGGFSFDHPTIRTALWGSYYTYTSDKDTIALTLPHWFLISILLIPPMAWLAFGRARRQRRRLQRGLCPSCGYDLRMHQPGSRCPECGAAVITLLALPTRARPKAR